MDANPSPEPVPRLDRSAVAFHERCVCRCFALPLSPRTVDHLPFKVVLYTLS
jgi:hypothetical protein